MTGTYNFEMEEFFSSFLRRAGMPASAGLSCCSSDTAAHSDYFVLMRLLNTLTHSLTHSLTYASISFQQLAKFVYYFLTSLKLSNIQHYIDNWTRPEFYGNYCVFNVDSTGNFC